MTNEGPESSGAPSMAVDSNRSRAIKDRIAPIDLFRGITLAGMIMVNNPGSWSHIHPALRHASWHGLGPADIVFPFFLFIMGVSAALSISSRIRKGFSGRDVFRQVARRSIILLAIGLAMSAFPFYPMERLASMRIPGVLQRIALVYFFSSTIFLYTRGKRTVVTGLALILLHWALLSLVPVPGVGPANLTPAGNLGAWIDRAFFGSHLWRLTAVWDPEGLLGTLPAVSSALFGMSAWNYISEGLHGRRTALMALAGFACVPCALAWNAVFPINKNLWTGSFVLITTGLALVVLSALFLLSGRVRTVRWQAPFIAFGTNTLVIFVMSELFSRMRNIIMINIDGAGTVSLHQFLYDCLFAGWMSPVYASMSWAALCVLLWLVPAWLLYRSGTVIKL
jgi:predicted acyltransferase